MSCKIIKERERVTKIEYVREFWNYADGGGLSFPCDKDGNLFDDMNDAAKRNYEWGLEHPERFDIYNKVQEHEYTYTEPAIAQCRCGEEFSLVNEYLGACECPKCGQWYNLFGQEVINPEHWNEGEDW